jgi:hypothetical protein
MAMKPIPDADELHQLLDYNPKTGEMHWKARTPEMFPATARYSADMRCKRWNDRYAGKLINNVTVRGYQIVGIW